MTFGVVNLGKAMMILGHDWLKKHNPEVNWTTGEVKMTQCPPACRHARKLQEEVKVSWITEEEEEITIGMVETEEVVEAEEDDCIFFSFIRASEMISQKLHREAMDKGEVPEMKKARLIPDEYKEFSRVFKKSSFDEMPPQRPWDHAIKLKPGSEPKFCKVYPLNPEEQK